MKSEIPVIFGNIKLILSVHERLQEKLADTINKFDFSKEKGTTLCSGIAILFKEYADNFRVYDQYAANWQNSVKLLLKNRESNSNFKKFEQSTSNTTNRLMLDDFLVKPIQRLLKYSLLFKEMSKNTEESSPDFKYIQEVKEKFEEISNIVNQSTGELLRDSSIKEVAKLIDNFPGGNLNDGQRAIVKQGKVMKMNPQLKLQQRHLFLFSDLLIYCKGKKRFDCKGVIELKDCLVSEIDDRSELKKIKNENLFGFSIVNLTSKRKIGFYCKTESEKSKFPSFLFFILFY